MSDEHISLPMNLAVHLCNVFLSKISLPSFLASDNSLRHIDLCGLLAMEVASEAFNRIDVFHRTDGPDYLAETVANILRGKLLADYGEELTLSTTEMSALHDACTSFLHKAIRISESDAA